MEIVAAVVFIGVFALLFLAGDVAASGTETAFTAYFRGWRPDPWPHGVQEEYIERPWGSARPVESPLFAGSDEALREPDRASAEIVDVVPSRPAQRPGIVAAAGAVLGSSTPRSGGAQVAFVTQRVGGHRLRLNL
ncbi:MAG: hypothetical protein M3301_01595 [Chloroflexota bacterium]|nr:hypothetical protein [Chloroflexota bacterium]